MRAWLLLRSRPPSTPAIHRGAACIIPIVGLFRFEIYRTVLREHGFVGSMSRRGNPYDNAKAESFMKTLKVEAVYLMAYETFDDVTADLPASSMRTTTLTDSTPRLAI